MKTEEQRPTVVIVGAGFGGIAAAKRLKKAPVRTVVIDQNNYHLFAPLLYQVSTALLEPGEIATPTRAILRKVKNSEFKLAKVSDVDFDAKVVKTDRGDVAYDYVILAAGSKTNYFGNHELEKATVGMKNLNDALDLKNRVLELFELARWVSEEERRRLLSFVVVGGGSTGIETAGAIQELIHNVLRKDFKEMSIQDARVTLLEAGDRLLPPFHEKLQKGAARQLQRKGIEVKLNTALKEVRGVEAVLSTGETMPTGMVVWAAGVCASDLGAEISDKLERGRTVPVGPTLQLEGRPEVFVIGDLAATKWKGQQLPMIAPVASQGGKHAARNIKHMLKGEPLEDFSYLDKGIMSTIGRNSAVMQFRGIRTEGFFAWLSWLFVHLVLIVSGFAQIRILINWFWNYIKNDRPARLILKPHDAMATTESVSEGNRQEPAPGLETAKVSNGGAAVSPRTEESAVRATSPGSGA